jgi:hypothetical protein
MRVGHAPLVFLAVLAMSTSSCAFFSGRLPCGKDSDCLSGDVCADDGYCGPGRTPANSGEGEGSGGEGEGEGAPANRVRTVSTTIGSIVDVGVELNDDFKLHVLPFGATLCSSDDCTPSTSCDVAWSANVELVEAAAAATPAPEQGVTGIGDATVLVVVETTPGFAGSDATMLGGVSGQFTLPAGHNFTEVTYAASGSPVDCANGTASDNRCHGAFASNCP